MAYIYKLQFNDDDRVYIGQTSNTLAPRYNEHCKSLKNNVHHSTKLQKKYNEVQVLPNLEIVEECKISLLFSREIYWVSTFNSFHNGFNGTIGGVAVGKGEDHPNSLYTMDDYTCVLTFLALTNLTSSEIAQETGMSIRIIDNISAQHSHVYLQELMPIEYAAMLKRNRHCRKDYPNIISPEGIIWKVDNATKFAKEHSLDRTQLCDVLLNRAKFHKGWRLETTKPPAEYCILSPEGTMYKFFNITAFAKAHGLIPNNLNFVIRGKSSHHKGWRLATEEEIQNANY